MVMRKRRASDDFLSTKRGAKTLSKSRNKKQKEKAKRARHSALLAKQLELMNEYKQKMIDEWKSKNPTNE